MLVHRLFSKAENAFWWKGLTQTQKEELVELAVSKQPTLTFHIGDKSYLGEEYPTHFSFNLLMEIIGRFYR